MGQVSWTLEGASRNPREVVKPLLTKVDGENMQPPCEQTRCQGLHSEYSREKENGGGRGLRGKGRECEREEKKMARTDVVSEYTSHDVCVHACVYMEE